MSSDPDETSYGKPKPERGHVGEGRDGFVCRDCGSEFGYSEELNGWRICPDCDGYLRTR